MFVKSLARKGGEVLRVGLANFGHGPTFAIWPPYWQPLTFCAQFCCCGPRF